MNKNIFHNFYYNNIQRFCQNCYAYKYCGSCLFHIENIDKVDKKGFICDNFQNQEDFKNYLKSIFTFLEKYPRDYFDILKNVVIE